MQKEPIIKVEHLSKKYKLGMIGGTTLRDDLQRLSAKLWHKEDITKKIGAKDIEVGKEFLALDDVSFDIYEGEAVGIIGHNGAGKSTLLKLLSRVTAPTEGKISYNGKISSMLEVGTGFNGELTGRENIYMNGAILGMTKAEITSKIDKIIEFSEVEQFIDTPVKRYSSGMYVKLAFSVAAHLDSEIMIMDEVLAVGDLTFQQKCLAKMRSVAKEENRTVLYVSHNMSTIRQLCDRCIVMSHGKIVFEGDVESAITLYSDIQQEDIVYDVDFSDKHATAEFKQKAYFESLHFDYYEEEQKLDIKLKIESGMDSTFIARFKIFDMAGQVVTSAYVNEFCLSKGKSVLSCILDISKFCHGQYSVDLILMEYKNGIQIRQDLIRSAFSFKNNLNTHCYGVEWNANWIGRILQDNIYGKVEKCK